MVIGARTIGSIVLTFLLVCLAGDVRTGAALSRAPSIIISSKTETAASTDSNPIDLSATLPESLHESSPVRPAASLDEQIAQTESALFHQIENAGLDANELNNRYNHLAEKAFYESLPAGIKAGYIKLHTLIRQQQDQVLAEDGMTRDFFNQLPGEAAPDWVLQHALYLEKQPLPKAVQTFVEAHQKSFEIQDADLDQLVSLCERNWLCIEKSAYIWIKSNLPLTDEQHEALIKIRKEIES